MTSNDEDDINTQNKIKQNKEVNENEYKKPKVEFKTLSVVQKLLYILRGVTIEPPVFLVSISSAMAIIISPSFLLDKVCSSTLSYPHELCQNLTSNSTLEKNAQTIAANLNMARIIMETIPAIFFALFLGPWSDRFGRKKAITFPAVGGLLSMTLLLIIAFFRMIPPEVVLLAALAQSIAGGFMGIATIGGTYLSDITTPKTRTTRLAILQMSFMIATPIGSTLCGVLFQHVGGHVAVFGVGFLLNLSALLYIRFVVKETITISPEDKNKNLFLAFFNFKNLRDSYRAVTKKRDKNQRTHLFLIFGISFLFILIALGEASILYLFVRWKFFMSEMTFSLLFAVVLVIDALGLMSVPFLTGICKIPANVLGLLSGVSRILTSTAVYLSYKVWMLFAGCSFVMLADVYIPVTRSIMSQCVSSQELGKVFSIVAALEAAAPALGSILYTQVYNATIATNPGAVFLMSVGIAVIPLSMMSFLLFDRRKYNWNEEKPTAEMTTVKA